MTVATAKMLTANKGKSRLGASVSIKFSQEFASNVSWQKIDERTGAEIPDEDIIDGGGDVPRVMVAKWSLNPFAVQTMRNREESIRILPDYIIFDSISYSFCMLFS